MSIRRVEVPELRRSTRADALPFETTAELEPLCEPLGQERAVEALRFAFGELRPGYNLIVVGPSGYGKHAFVESILRQAAKDAAVPSDWCYVEDFRSPQVPRALELPAGRGRELARDLDHLVEELRASIPAAFESEVFQSRMQQIEAEFRAHPEQVFAEIEAEALREDIAVARVPHGLAFAPLRGGQVLDPAAFEALPEADKKQARQRVQALEEKLQQRMKQLPEWAKEAREKVRALRLEVTRLAVDRSFEDLKAKYDGLAPVQAWMEDLRADVLEHSPQFRKEDEEPTSIADLLGRKNFSRYRVNVLVDNSETRGAPVVYDDRPALDHLLGRIEHRAELGALISDFTLIKAGSLHRANGGYLIVDLRKILSYPHAWESLKRALFSRELRIESLPQVLGLSATATLEPAPIPLDVKVVVIGDRLLHHLLSELDPDVGELFRIVAEFDDRVDRTADAELGFARHAATIGRARSLKPLDRQALASVLDHASRLAGDSRKLSTSWRDIETLLVEADHWASDRNADCIQAPDVKRAIEMRVRRRDLVQRRVQESILSGTLLVDTGGEQVGQTNGLSVVEIGGIPFGWPTRITATTRVGDGKLVDIEREVELGGALHSKGVLILSSYFAGRYTRQIPLSLSASLVFEQTYGGVEGDSASLAELCALLSSLAQAPVRQSLAVTGSVNQHGQVQAIGAVNDKIEGFFEICRARGLDGKQGVIIPSSNQPHLMLAEEVVQACAAGQFNVWAVDTADDAIEILTGVPAGAVNEEGEFPDDSLNARVLETLLAFAVVAEGFSKFVEVKTGSEAAGTDQPNSRS